MQNRLLTPEQVVSLLALDSDGCDSRTARERLRHRCRSRQLPFVRIGRLIRFRESDIAATLDRETVPAVGR
jgi:predicted DNA-binding transcriptional regulator AlpA